MRAFEIVGSVVCGFLINACVSATPLVETEDPGASSSPSDQPSSQRNPTGAAPEATPSAIFESNCRATSNNVDTTTLSYGNTAPTESGWYGSTLTVVTDARSKGFRARRPTELVKNSAAQDPSYVFLRRDVDAVRLPGPTVVAASAAELAAMVTPDGAGTQSYLWGNSWEDGIRFTLNGRIRFDVKIVDFEDEIALGWVELVPTGNVLQTSFSFIGVGGGVAHDVQITAYVDDVPGCASVPITIEVRPE